MATRQTGTGAGVFDNTLMFMSSGNLTRGSLAALKPTSGLKIRGTPAEGLAVRIQFPRMSGTTVKLLPQLYVSMDDSTYRVQSQYPGGYLSNTPGTANAIEVMVPFEAISAYKYAKLGFALVGGTTGSSWGAVKAGIVQTRGHGDWTRNVRWD